MLSQKSARRVNELPIVNISSPIEFLSYNGTYRKSKKTLVDFPDKQGAVFLLALVI